MFVLLMDVFKANFLGYGLYIPYGEPYGLLFTQNLKHRCRRCFCKKTVFLGLFD